MFSVLDELDLNKIRLTDLHKDRRQWYYYHARFKGKESEAKSKPFVQIHM